MTATSSTEHGPDDRAEPAADAGPTEELVALRLELWEARDAAIGAIAEAGTLRARNRELEALIHQLRVEVDRLAHVEHSLTYRVGDKLVSPLRVVRRLSR